MRKILPTLLATCFLIEPLYLLIKGLYDPVTERLEKQHSSFAVFLVISAVIPSLAYILYGKWNIGVLKAVYFMLFSYFIAFVWIIKNELEPGIINDFAVSAVFVCKGISIGAFFLREDIAPYTLKNLSIISIIISILYILFVFSSQILAGISYPGLGGATYQKASYIFAQLIILNHITYKIFNLNHHSALKYSIFILNVLLFLAILYNGGRGAALIIIILTVKLLYNFVRTILLKKNYKVTKYNLLVFVTILSSVSLFSLVSPDILNSIGKGFNRIFEIFLSLSQSNQFDMSALSHRDDVYQINLESISQAPVIGYGPLWSARLVNPAHNIFLNLLMDYGLPVGSFLIVILLYLSISKYQYKHIRIYYLIFSPAFIYLMFSGNYLLTFEFWIFLTIILSTNRFSYRLIQ